MVPSLEGRCAARTAARRRRELSTRATSTTPRRSAAAASVLPAQHGSATYERVEAAQLFVVKSDGVRQEFDREKLAVGLRKA